MFSEFLLQKVEKTLKKHSNVLINPSRNQLIREVVKNREAIVSKSGALSSWTKVKSTGRSPSDTYIVHHEAISTAIDWKSPVNNPMDPEIFDAIFDEALEVLSQKPSIYETNRVIGADISYALPVKLVTSKALSALFADNMFLPVPNNIETSIFKNCTFTFLALPDDKLQPGKYEGKQQGNKTSDMIIAMDFHRKLGLVYGSAYLGSIKKLMFTVMNYLLPEQNILPLHCSANEGKDGNTAFFLGLSGTGKTTLSTDPKRKLIGDDEHGWSDTGIANFENGCYAKLIHLNPEKEPEIYDIVSKTKPLEENGVIMENIMTYPDGTVDFDDERLTENSRTSYPISFLKNIKSSGLGDHPNIIIFLTADAYGVLPPVAKLNESQAMLWFLMGYTSKLAGTETGITEPKATFSKFFGEPFMPRNPEDYASLLGEKIKKHNTSVYLVNTGWSGGCFSIGERMSITITRSIIDAALNGDLEKVEYEEDFRFHILIPKFCPNVDANLLSPKNTWEDKELFETTAQKLAEKFSLHFDKIYGDKNIREEIKKTCPGK